MTRGTGDAVHTLPRATVEELLERARTGDDQSMDDLLRHIAPFVRRICLSIARGHTPDAVQEAMVAIFRGMCGVREPAAFYGWVRAVTVREAVRTVRRLSREPSGAMPDLHQDGNPLVGVHIRDVMRRLPDHHREILTLRAVYGMNEQEMAATLTVPIGTVRSRLHRARQNFEEAWYQVAD